MNAFEQESVTIEELKEERTRILTQTDIPSEGEWGTLKGIFTLEEAIGEPLSETYYTLLVNTGAAPEFAENHAINDLGLDTASWPLDDIDWDNAAESLLGAAELVSLDNADFYVTDIDA